MTDVADTEAPCAKTLTMDWEGFFKNYRKPDFITGYVILNKLGGGVFGDVYKARKTSIGKFYAIKFLKIQDERLSEQVLRELQAVDHFAQVDHPNLVSIEDRGEVGGIPFIVMGYAGDETLKVLLRHGPIPTERARSLFQQMLEGVKALHEHAIIHFDLKPANVFIKGEVARIGDYGLSKLMTESRATLSMGRGTPYYMAPEMLRRRGDARSDVYSLGVILFEMLTGDVPFGGDTEWEILKRHETDAVVVPATVPGPLADFIRRSLVKDPEQRFRNAGEQLEAFEVATATLDGTAESVPPAPATAAATPTDPTPLARQVGATAGRLAWRGRVSLDGVRSGLHEVLVSLREATRDTVNEAIETYRSQRARGATPSEAKRALLRGRWEAHRDAARARRELRRSRRVARHAVEESVRAAAGSGTAVRRRPFSGVRRTLGFPFRLFRTGLRHLFGWLVILGLIAGLCYLVDLGLRSLIL